MGYGGNRNVIHKRLKQARKAMGMTQDTLAAKMQVYGLNIVQNSISKIEINERIVTDYELICICKILKIDMNTLFDKIFDETH